ncbi:methyl-accepting chemotaxis protein [Photobacterium sanguinicancri]|uniref:methyl-accepting chemotaxis protein n=1 Tax=Photobacterium sanguinicancri TaxID=875932 RepID=UPI0021C49685|nr:methyl-accepting chemotaxis protein [Photobacterium sanguinicancri]
MNIKQLTIKQKLAFSFIFAILISTSLVGFVSQRQAHHVIEQRLLKSELPATLMQFNRSIDKEISILLAAAEQLGNSRLLTEKIQPNPIANQDLSVNQDTVILDELKAVKQQYQLIDASIANRHTGTYWMDSFTESRQHRENGWFTKLVASGQEKSLSVYREDSGEVKLFLNYQRPHGRSLAGLSKSMNGMVSFINQFTLEQTGFIYLVDNQGTFRLHKNTQKLGKATLQSEYSASASQQLLNKTDFNFATVDRDGKEILIATSYIPSMDWFVVAEVPHQEIFSELDKATQQIMIWTLVIAALFALVALWLANSITRPISNLAATFKDLGEGEGDLRHRIDVEGKDEIAQLSQGFNGFISKIHLSVREVAETGNALRSAAEAVASQAQLTLDNSHSQRDRTIQVVTAINQMGATVNEIAGNAAQAADAAQNAESETQNGQTVVGQARNTINQLSNDVANVSDVIGSLANNTQAIGSILDTIRGISEQTNLLALNAAIEAARAGEQGRGFAVVADEVRNLASRTSDSTNEIQSMINRLQEEASNAVGAMQQSRQLTSDGVSSADEASAALVSIADRISLISDMNTQVATATEEQSTVVNDINCNIEEINDTTQRTAETAALLADSSQELRALSQRLDSMVGTFKL